MVDSSSEVSWFEEVDGVKVGNVDTPGVGLWALRPVLLDVHPEEADVDPVLLLEGEHGAGAVWEVIQHVPSVHIPAKMIDHVIFNTLKYYDIKIYFSGNNLIATSVDINREGWHQHNASFSFYGGKC